MLGRRGAFCSCRYRKTHQVRDYRRKLDALEQFHPERMASRILGMGDVLTIIEKAEEAFNAEQALKLEEKLRKEEFTLEDFFRSFRMFARWAHSTSCSG